MSHFNFTLSAFETDNVKRLSKLMSSKLPLHSFNKGTCNKGIYLSLLLIANVARLPVIVTTNIKSIATELSFCAIQGNFYFL